MNFYHILNRGVDKRKTFLSNADYARFIHDLWEFNNTQPANNNLSRALQAGTGTKTRDVRRPSLERLVRVHFFCLMPNHYHLLVSPIDDNLENLSLFMKKLNGGYSKYFNEKNERSGALWQGKYKSVPIETDRQFLYIPYYIHFNALDLKYPAWREKSLTQPKQAADYLKTYRWSSHLDYLGQKNFPSVTDRSFFLEYFGGEKGYATSIHKMLRDMSIVESLSGVTLE